MAMVPAAVGLGGLGSGLRSGFASEFASSGHRLDSLWNRKTCTAPHCVAFRTTCYLSAASFRVEYALGGEHSLYRIALSIGYANGRNVATSGRHEWSSRRHTACAPCWFVGEASRTTRWFSGWLTGGAVPPSNTFPGRNGGQATFIGRRVPAQALADWLSTGGTLEAFSGRVQG